MVITACQKESVSDESVMPTVTPAISTTPTVTKQVKYTTVEKPVASVPEGDYSTKTDLKLTLECRTEGAEIYYSLNGASFLLYSGEIVIDQDTRLMTYAKLGGKSSEVVMYYYQLADKLETPTASFELEADGGVSAGEDIDKVEEGQAHISSDHIVEKDSILNDYTQKYFYQQLDENQKKAYAALYEGIAAHKEEIHFEEPTLYDWSLGYVFQLLRFENPQFFWMYDGYSYDYYEDGKGVIVISCIRPVYAYTADECKMMQKEIEKNVPEFRRALVDCKDEYDIVLAIHDEIVNKTDYDQDYASNPSQNLYNAYGALVDKLAVCQGYANAFSYLCQLMGIQCVNVNGHGAAMDEFHEWNRVCVDGKWYNMDVTWDDPVFWDNSQILLHDYFCITDEVLALDHIAYDWFPFGEEQKATDEGLNYFTKQGLDYYIDCDEAYDALIQSAAKNYKNGALQTRVYCHNTYCIGKLYDRINANTDAVFKRLNDLDVYVDNYYYGYSGNEFTLTLEK